MPDSTVCLPHMVWRYNWYTSYLVSKRSNQIEIERSKFKCKTALKSIDKIFLLRYLHSGVGYTAGCTDLDARTNILHLTAWNCARCTKESFVCMAAVTAFVCLCLVLNATLMLIGGFIFSFRIYNSGILYIVSCSKFQKLLVFVNNLVRKVRRKTMWTSDQCPLLIF